MISQSVFANRRESQLTDIAQSFLGQPLRRANLSTAKFDDVVYTFPTADIARQAVHALNTLIELSTKLEKLANELEVLHKRSQFRVVEDKSGVDQHGPAVLVEPPTQFRII